VEVVSQLILLDLPIKMN